jgi:hypothetical protein
MQQSLNPADRDDDSSDWPDGIKARLCFHLQQDAFDTDSLIGVLEQLAGFYADQQVVLLWTGWARTGATRCAPPSTPAVDCDLHGSLVACHW